MNSFTYILYILLLLTVKMSLSQQIDIQGHRGARGLYPENTIQGMKIALDHGVTTLELDVVITQDKQVLLSHEPYLSSEICLQPNGNRIPEAAFQKFNIYQLSYDQVKQYDCGSRINPRFPNQKKVVEFKPLLRDMIIEIEAYILEKGYSQVNYNIEIKSKQATDHEYHPAPAEFSDLLFNELSALLPPHRVIIQSFDFRVLKYWEKQYPEYKLAALVERGANAEVHLMKLGFTPDIYSPYFKLLSRKKVSKLQSKGMLVIPWTVNETKDMERLAGWGVNGIITDYPDRAAFLR